MRWPAWLVASIKTATRAITIPFRSPCSKPTVTTQAKPPVPVTARLKRILPAMPAILPMHWVNTLSTAEQQEHYSIPRLPIPVRKTLSFISVTAAPMKMHPLFLYQSQSCPLWVITRIRLLRSAPTASRVTGWTNGRIIWPTPTSMVQKTARLMFIPTSLRSTRELPARAHP